MSSSSDETILLTGTPNAILNINMSNVTKLTATNFLMWSRQIQALLDGYDLVGHIDGSRVVPPPTTTTENAVTTNPAYTAWKRQDRLIYSALLGAITPTIQPILSTTTTATEIWSTLNATYVKPSRGHFKQLKQQLKATTKGIKSINEYVQGLTAIFDQLALLGKPEDPEDQIDAILEGLPEDYKTLIDQVESSDTPPFSQSNQLLSLLQSLRTLPTTKATITTIASKGTSVVAIKATTAVTKLGNNNNNFKQLLTALLPAVVTKVNASFVESLVIVLGDVHNCRVQARCLLLQARCRGSQELISQPLILTTRCHGCWTAALHTI